MKQVFFILAVMALMSCGQRNSVQDHTQLLNMENANQGLKAEVARLNAENAQLKAALAGKRPPPAPIPNRPLPAGILSVDSKGRPTFSSLKPEAAVQYFNGMHLDRIKQLYGNPIAFKEHTMANLKCNYAGYIAGRPSYPKNIYNAGTEKFEGWIMTFYVELNTYKCVAIYFHNKLLITPCGKSVGMHR